MKTALLFISVISALISFSSCKEKRNDTRISGFVTDSLSGAPIANMKVEFGSGFFLGGFTPILETYTDNSGFYVMQYDTPDKEGLFTFSANLVKVEEKGMTPKSEVVELELDNRVDLKPARIPAFIELIFQNQIGDDSVIVEISQQGRFQFNETIICRADSDCESRIFQVMPKEGVKLDITRYTLNYISSKYTRDEYIFNNQTKQVIINY